jgi:pSer/pThr/pTyr-binding forkhead associated (FHA) protein
MPCLIVVSHRFHQDDPSLRGMRVEGSLPVVGSSIPLGQEVTHFTRSQHFPCGPNDGVILLPVIGVQRRHAEIRHEGGTFVLVDLHSRNGVVLNGRRIDPFTPEPLRDGDEIEVTGFRFVFRSDSEPY